jgi:hypothetical protein
MFNNNMILNENAVGRCMTLYICVCMCSVHYLGLTRAVETESLVFLFSVEGGREREKGMMREGERSGIFTRR